MIAPEHPAFQVTKASGNTEQFDEEKLRNSLRRSGATPDLIERVIQALGQGWHEGMTTKSIYKKAYKLLKRLHRPTAARYTLKQAMFELGPSGGPFEDFVAALLKNKGYQVQVRQQLPGLCIQHEVDVVAINEFETIWVECKYHPLPGSVSNVKIPLYIHSRFRDLEQYWANHPVEGQPKRVACWLVTNTRFSEDAAAYGRCAGLSLVGWNYPNGNSLREMVDRSGLHPITCLGALTRQEKQRLLEAGLVLSKDLARPGHWVNLIGASEERKKKIMQEAINLWTESGG